MFDLVNGIPLHPLVVHAVVVLLPLAVVGTLAIALVRRWRVRYGPLVRRWRVRYGPLVVACAAVATALIPVATSSGEALERRVGDPGEHAQLGDQLIWFALPLLVLSAALVAVEWRRTRTADRGAEAGSGVADDGRRGAGLVRALAVLAVVAALGSAVQVYRVGDSGARAAWGDVPSPQAASTPAGP